MKVYDITKFLETVAPLSLQEDYDNCGLITGDANDEIGSLLISLDVTEEVIREAIENKCGLIIAHHPLVFKGLKKFSGSGYTERALILAIKNNIAVYASHTNLDNILAGVSGKMATLLGLKNVKILAPKKQLLYKLAVFVPVTHADKLRDALFNAGAGNIGNYSECSFSVSGTGTFTPGEESDPYSGSLGIRESASEEKVEVIFPYWMENQVIAAMKANHPYEEVAHDIYRLENAYQETGSGVRGEFETPLSEPNFLKLLADVFKTPVIKHSRLTGKPVKKIALCGGSGSFLISAAKAWGADAYVTADIKYHEFFDADNRLLLADIGHFESEQYTIDLIFDLLSDKFPNFALLKTGVKTNPVHCFIP